MSLPISKIKNQLYWFNAIHFTILFALYLKFNDWLWVLLIFINAQALNWFLSRTVRPLFSSEAEFAKVDKRIVEAATHLNEVSVEVWKDLPEYLMTVDPVIAKQDISLTSISVLKTTQPRMLVSFTPEFQASIYPIDNATLEDKRTIIENMMDFVKRKC